MLRHSPNVPPQPIDHHQYFITNFFSTQYKHFSINVLIFIAYKSLCLVSQKTDKNISNEKYAKLRNLSKIKELDQIVLRKGLFPSIKGHLCLTKGNLYNLEGQVEVEPPLLGS